MKYGLICGWLFIFLQACQAQPAPGCEHHGGTADYLDRVGCASDFNYLQGRPLSEKFGYAQSLKIVYDIRNEHLYFTNASLYPFHYDFCTKVLGEEDDLATFNRKNYSDQKQREYLLCNLNYYSSADVYALEMMPEDDSKAAVLYQLYQDIAAHVYFGSKISMLVSSPEMAARLSTIPALPQIDADVIYKGRQYVSLNKGVAYGYLRKITVSGIDSITFNKHDIVILDGLPNQLPVVAGVLSVPFQTPLCHISLLCVNRGTPNATYRTAWNSPELAALANKLVYFEVTADTFFIRAATETEAKKAWARIENRKPILLSVDTSQHQLIELSTPGAGDVAKVGGKASNFAELSKIRIDGKQLPLPEGAFAIPFYYYYQHLREQHIQSLVDSILDDPSVRTDPRLLNQRLHELRTRIKQAPLNAAFLATVKTRLIANGNEFSNYRFRSSTNAEDVKGFNGAGLYDSKTGSLTDRDKPIEKAIKAVWASLWEERAFAEREYFRIDQHSVAMGLLVHRAFGEELANGVAITKHMYREGYPAYTINVQVGEISVVNPPDTVTCDEAIIGLGEATGSGRTEIEYIGRSNLSKSKPVLSNEQLQLLTRYLTAIKTHYYYKVEKGAVRNKTAFWDYALDIEFKIDSHTGKLYIKQARPL